MIDLTDLTDQSISPYDLRGVFETEPDFKTKTTLARHKSGKTLSEYPVLLYLLHVMDQCGQEVQKFYSNVTFKVAESLSLQDKLSASLDIKPDTSMAYQFHGELVVFFFTEMHSGTITKSYCSQGSIKPCGYASIA